MYLFTLYILYPVVCSTWTKLSNLVNINFVDAVQFIDIVLFPMCNNYNFHQLYILYNTN